jgi:hypothetical protein
MRRGNHVLVGVWALPIGSHVFAPGERKRFTTIPSVNAVVRTLYIHPLDDVYVHSVNFGGGEELFTSTGPILGLMFGPCSRSFGIHFSHPELTRDIEAIVELEYKGENPTSVYACASVTPTEGTVYCWRCGASEWTDYPALAQCEVCGGRRHDREDPEWSEDN